MKSYLYFVQKIISEAVDPYRSQFALAYYGNIQLAFWPFWFARSVHQGLWLDFQFYQEFPAIR